MEFLAIIPARYASTRFPGKPLAMMNGKTMIHRVWEQALKAFKNVYVATDDPRIYDHVVQFGGNVVMTSKRHKTGTDRCAEAAKIIMEEKQETPEVIVNVQGDEPFAQKEQFELIKSCFRYKRTQIATLAKPINNKDDIFNPHKPKLVLNRKNEAIFFSRSPVPFVRGKSEDKWISKHQFYKHIGIYAYRYEALLKITTLPRTELEKAESLEQLRWIEYGYRIKVAFTEHENISVDTPKDLQRLQDIGLI